MKRSQIRAATLLMPSKDWWNPGYRFSYALRASIERAIRRALG